MTRARNALPETLLETAYVHWITTPPLPPMYELTEPAEVSAEVTHQAESIAAARPRARSILSSPSALLHRHADGAAAKAPGTASDS